MGSLLRTAEGLAIHRVYLTGYTPYPQEPDDKRMPHISRRVNAQISKTALGAENMVPWRHLEELSIAVEILKKEGYFIAALEQTNDSIPLNEFKAPAKIALIVGNEVDGLNDASLRLADKILCIPMSGSKESFNVAVAAAMALYHLRYQA